MNFLAHAWPSFNEPEILAGNMISDFVKGKRQFDFPRDVIKGIRLHRAIDEFTDNHPATAEVKNFFKPYYRLYSGAITDVVFDYFLANDKNEFSHRDELKSFSESSYKKLDSFQSIFPDNFKRVYGYMKEQNWLYNYGEEWLIRRSLQGLERRAKFLEESGIAYQVFTDNKISMLERYTLFFPEVKAFAAHTLAGLLKS